MCRVIRSRAVNTYKILQNNFTKTSHSVLKSLVILLGSNFAIPKGNNSARREKIRKFSDFHRNTLKKRYGKKNEA